jgi:hypothetical protein
MNSENFLWPYARTIRCALYQRGRIRRDESGAVLLLALIFIIVVTLSIFGLITFGGTGILNATNLQGQRSLEFAADGATTAAIQAVRYSNYAFTTTGVEDCLPDGTVLAPTAPTGSGTKTMVVNQIPISVDCTAATSSPPSGTREINFYACQQTSSSYATTQCLANNSILVAKVSFDDVSSSGLDACSYPPNSATCGSGMTIEGWVDQTANN